MKTPMSFTPSKYQCGIFDRMSKLFNDGTDNLGVIARAGSGKTTTLVKGLQYIPATADSVFCAFNKSIQLELAERLPKYIESRTFHSLGLSNIKTVNPKVKVNTYKAYDIFDYLVPPPDKYDSHEEKQDHRTFKSNFIKAFGLGRNNLIDFNNERDVWELLEAMDLDGYEPRIASILPEAIKLDLNDEKEIDFDDMISWPLYNGLSLGQYDFMAIDEAQDLNAAQIEMVKRSLKENGKACIVGDPRQSIYGFRGADHYAMEKLLQATQATQLPLSITYRCPIKVVELAQRFVPDLEFRPDAPDGIVENISESKMYQLAQPKDMILCRMNAPLAPIAFSFIRKSIKATIMGKDLGKSLAAIAQKIVQRSSIMKEVYELLYQQRKSEIQKVMDNPHIKNVGGKIVGINDKYDTLVAIADNCQQPHEFPIKTEDLFSDTTDGIILSTVHKAKGLEAYRVFILRPDLMPHPLAKTPAAMTQEENLQYVAWTRSKAELYFVS
jgi:DNA helicase-2/ATP-dependent DNA helicase PcrA